MFGAVPAEWLYELAGDMGVMTQLELDIPRHYVIDEEFLSSCIVSFHHLNGKGQKTGSTGSVDHPAFAALRKHLGALEYIEIQTMWNNGDRVLKPFYLNDRFFDEGDQFSCASAMGNSFRSSRKLINKKHDETKLQSGDSSTIRVG